MFDSEKANKLKMYQISRTIYLHFAYMEWFQEILVLLPIAWKLFQSFESSSSQIFMEFLLKLGKAHNIVGRK